MHTGTTRPTPQMCIHFGRKESAHRATAYPRWGSFLHDDALFLATVSPVPAARRGAKEGGHATNEGPPTARAWVTDERVVLHPTEPSPTPLGPMPALHKE